MGWKWYENKDDKVSVGGQGSNYGGVQLMRESFYALLKFHKEGPLPDATASTRYEQRFYGHMDYQQMQMMVDLLRNEKPINFGWYDAAPQ